MAVELCYWEHLREEERETEPERGEKGRAAMEEIRRRGRRPGAAPRVLLSRLGGKQEVATAVTWEPPRRCSTKKTKEYFQKAPLASGFSPEFLKQHKFAIFCELDLSKSL
jgi:hypothetical protein